MTAIEGKVNNLTIVFETASTIGIAATISPIPKSRLQKVEEGLRLIISHFYPTEHLWPRTISTHWTERKQIVVYNMEDVMERFKEANYLDCYISAYPVYHKEYIERIGIVFVPSLLFCDLDREHFSSDEEFKAFVKKLLLILRRS